MYTMTASDVQNFLTTDFMPVILKSENIANTNNVRGVFVFLVTSGGSGYPNGTFYTKLKGDGSGGIARLVVSGNQITVFGDTTSKMQNYGSGYSFASFDLSGSNIYTNTTATTQLNNTYVGEGGATGLLTAWNNATTAVSLQLL